jgi:uncharacterized protein YkvS
MASNNKKARQGDLVSFERRDSVFEGEVFLIKENSVLVNISKESAQILGYETTNTVVRHGNYSIKLNK